MRSYSIVINSINISLSQDYRNLSWKYQTQS